MALVAIHAVVHVPAHVPMIPVGIRLCVAVRALEHTVVGRVGVAGRAHAVRIAVIHREPGVVKGGSQPARGRVTGGAGDRETG